MYQIPDGLPTLSREAHHPDDGRACVMEYISVITGDVWSDHPKCTDPIIATTAIALNDFIHSDKVRSSVMIPFIGRLIGTAHHGNRHHRLEYKRRLARVARELDPVRFDHIMHNDSTHRCGCPNCHHPHEQQLHYVCSAVAHRYTGSAAETYIITSMSACLERLCRIADDEFGRTPRETDTQQRLVELVAELV